MTKTLWLHVGHPKTGSTALQSFCGENRGLLSERGLSYPSMPDVLVAPNPSKNGLFLVSDLTGANRPDPTPEQSALMQTCLDVIAREFETHDSVLVSEEVVWVRIAHDSVFFWDVLTAHAREHGYTIKVIAYLRRQDLFAESRYQQMARTGTTAQHWENWLATQVTTTLDYYAVLNRFARIVGTGNIVVRIYDRTLLEKDGGSLFTDFLDALGISGNGDFKPPVLTKEQTTSCNFTACMRAVNVSPLHNKNLRAIMQRSAIVLSDASDTPKMSMFSAAAARDFLAQFEDNNDRIAREYLHRDGPLHAQEFPEVTEWTADNEWMARDMTRFFLEVNRRQNRRIAEAGASEVAGEGSSGDDSSQDGALQPGATAGGKPAEGEAQTQISATGPEEEWEAEEWESAAGSREESQLDWVMRCAADFFLLRQQRIEAGENVAPLDDDTVMCLLHSLMPQANTEVQLLGRFHEERARVLATRGTVTRLRATITEKNATIANLNSVIGQLEQALTNTLDRRLRRVLGRILRAPRSLGRRIAEKTRTQAAADAGRTDEHEE